MNSLERVSLALQHREPDRVPVYPIINSVARKVIGADYSDLALDSSICAEAIIKTTEMLDLDCICTLTDLSVEAADFGQKIIYPKDEAAYPDPNERLINSIDDYYRIEPVNPRKTQRMSEHIKLCHELVSKKGKEVPVVGFTFAPLGIASMLRGQENIFMDMIDEPDAVKAVIKAITETMKEYVAALAETGVHAIMFDTLFASQSILSKSMWLEFEGPCMEILAEEARKHNCMVMIHNCGKGIYVDAQIQTMKPELISLLHISDDCSSYAEMKEKYGSQTAFMGHVPPPFILSATPEEIEQECIEEMNTFKKDGGFILSTGCEYPSVASLDNARVMVNTAKKYGKY